MPLGAFICEQHKCIVVTSSSLIPEFALHHVPTFLKVLRTMLCRHLTKVKLTAVWNILLRYTCEHLLL